MDRQKSILVLVVILSCAGVCFGKYSGGTGEPNDPYKVATAEDMNAIGTHPDDWDKHFLLIADINLAEYTGTQFNIIGTDYYLPFTGVFDGNGHTIWNFTWDSNGVSYIGLFGYVGAGGEVKNLCMENVDVKNTSYGKYVYAGGLVGENWGTITNCYSTGSVSQSPVDEFYDHEFVGGLVGANRGIVSNCYATCSVSGGDFSVGGLAGSNGGTIMNCYATGTVSGDGYVGGLVGDNYGTITNCYSTGSVTGNNYVGGLVGGNGSCRSNRNSTITNCYSTAGVTGNYYVGGLIGGNWCGTISNCYSTGAVDGNAHAGGLVGYNDTGVIASFWDVNTTGQLISDGGEGKTTAEMQTMSTYWGWGCDPQVWTIDEGNDYPHLAWENNLGEPISPTLSDLLDGTGTQNDPYLIYTADELNMIGLFSCFNKHFRLMVNIDLGDFSGTQFNIIPVFTGIFDGAGYTISNFTYTTTDTDYIGLFGHVDGPNAEIRDLTLIEPHVNAAADYVGCLVGFLRNGTIINCDVEGGSVSGYSFIGGLVGVNYEGTIENCCSTGSVIGVWYIGGLVGGNWEGTISDCYATGSVAGVDDDVGGLVGDNYGTITNCYSTGSVSGRNSVGGLVGDNGGMISNCYATGDVSGDVYVGGLVGDNGGMISNCYATGSITGNDYVSGLVGRNYKGTISNCYATGEVSGDRWARGLVGYNTGTVTASFWDVNTSGRTTSYGGEGKTTARMQDINTFLDAGWDFVCETENGTDDVWMINEGVDYPKLVWDVGCFPCGHEDYDEWLAVGKPLCWCCPRQCHGDTDNRKEGSAKTGYFYVHFKDLNLLIYAWNIKEPPDGPGIAWPDPNICADFDHKAEGSTETGYYRAHFNDLNILLSNWNIKEPPDGPGIEPNCLDCP